MSQKSNFKCCSTSLLFYFYLLSFPGRGLLEFLTRFTYSMVEEWQIVFPFLFPAVDDTCVCVCLHLIICVFSYYHNVVFCPFLHPFTQL